MIVSNAQMQKQIQVYCSFFTVLFLPNFLNTDHSFPFHLSSVALLSFSKIKAYHFTLTQLRILVFYIERIPEFHSAEFFKIKLYQLRIYAMVVGCSVLGFAADLLVEVIEGGWFADSLNSFIRAQPRMKQLGIDFEKMSLITLIF